MSDSDVYKLVSPGDIPAGGLVPCGDLIEVYKVCTRLEQTCRRLRGVGLSATQVGIPWNLFVAIDGDRAEFVLDAAYEGVGEVKKSVEGCLSLLDPWGKLRYFEVSRYGEIRCRGRRLVPGGGLSLEEFDETLTGLRAVVYQHEIDHASQILISRGREVVRRCH